MLERLNIIITGTRFNTNGTVSIDFRGHNDPRNINLTGYIPDITMQEYFENVRSLEDMERYVRGELIEALSTPEDEEPVEEGTGGATAQTATFSSTSTAQPEQDTSNNSGNRTDR